MSEVERIPVEVKGLQVDPGSDVPMVILKGTDEDNPYVLPIWLGVFEANAIALEIEDVKPPRPMTHDLLLHLVEKLGGEVIDVVIRDVVDSTFYATVTLKRDGEEVEVDARPSDAIGLALRAKAPVFIHKSVIDKAQAFDINSTDPDKLRPLLASLGLDGFVV